MNTYKTTQIKPRPGYILVKPEEIAEEVAGLYQPNKEEEIPQWGKIEKVGAKSKETEVYEDFKKGKMVIYKKWGGNDVEIGGKKYYLLRFEEIIAVVE